MLGQCVDSGCIYEAYSHFLSRASAMLMTECVSLTGRERLSFLCASLCLHFSPFLRISFSLSFSTTLQLRRRHIWSPIKAPDVKRSHVAQLCAECGTILVVNVIRKIVYNISLWLLHQMSIVQAKAVQFQLIELQLWEGFYHFLSCATWFPFRFGFQLNIKHLIVKSKVYSHCNFIGTPRYFFHLAECSQSILNTSSPSTFQILLCFYFSPSLCPTLPARVF